MTPSLPLDPATLATLLRTVSDVLPHHPDATEADKAAQRDRAFTFLASLYPRDPLEAAFAARIIATHYAAIHAFARAEQSDLSPALQQRFHSQAISLTRHSNKLRGDLIRRQAGQVLRAITPPASRPASMPAVRRSRPDRVD
jgi:hypothetical protein